MHGRCVKAELRSGKRTFVTPELPVEYGLPLCYGRWLSKLAQDTAAMSPPLHNHSGLHVYAKPVEACRRNGKRHQAPNLAESISPGSHLSVAMFKKCRLDVQASPPARFLKVERPPDHREWAPNTSCFNHVLSDHFCSASPLNCAAAAESLARTSDKSSCSSFPIPDPSDGLATLPQSKVPSAYTMANQVLLQSHQDRLLRQSRRVTQQGPLGLACQPAHGVPKPGQNMAGDMHRESIETQLSSLNGLEITAAAHQGILNARSSLQRIQGENSCSFQEAPCGAGATGHSIPGHHKDSAYGLTMCKTEKEAKGALQGSWSDGLWRGHEKLHLTGTYCKSNTFLRQLQFS